MQFVFHHAPGARTLRFVRKMPLLKGLSDNALLDVAGRMTEEQFEVCQHLSTSNIYQQLSFTSTRILSTIEACKACQWQLTEGFSGACISCAAMIMGFVDCGHRFHSQYIDGYMPDEVDIRNDKLLLYLMSCGKLPPARILLEEAQTVRTFMDSPRIVSLALL